MTCSAEADGWPLAGEKFNIFGTDVSPGDRISLSQRIFIDLVCDG
jgi:hypothetical protein